MGYRLVPAGDACVVVAFEERVDPDLNAACVALANTVRAAGYAGVRDVVPTYNTVAVHFDPWTATRDRLMAELDRHAAGAHPEQGPDERPVDIGVCYGGEWGPDLSAVAEFAGATEEEVVSLHAGTDYRVYMLGFLPGFAYLGSVDSRIAVPRLSVPRLTVHAGSVGIGGVQTGVYPMDAPGGWRIIGRTAARLFDPSREKPFLLGPGDHVRFVPCRSFESTRQGS
jgi:inhibitor of KinA